MSTPALIVIIGVLLVGYTYLGYPVVCYLRARISPRRIVRRPSDDSARPMVSIIVAAYREALTIADKLATLAAQTYPPELIEVIVVCDGSDDDTEAKAWAAGAQYLPGRLDVFALATRRGKPAALNLAVSRARGEILVFTDARQRLSTNAVEELVADLGDPDVGAVGGQLVLEGDAPISAYWKYESQLRAWEGQHGSTVGVSGALYAMRRALYVPIPEETLLDDLLVPARVRLCDKRVAYQPNARAFDRVAPTGREFSRKARTLAGNFQLMLIEPKLFLPWRNPAFFDFVSHKLLRLLVPFLLLAAFVASTKLQHPYAFILITAQLSILGLAALRSLKLFSGWRVAGLCETYVVLNAAALLGLVRFVRYGRNQRW